MDAKMLHAIKKPDHYTWKGIECKEVIGIMTRGLSGADAYYLGNIIKYLYRYPKKGTPVKDVAKAAEYLTMLLHSVEGAEENGTFKEDETGGR